LMMQVPVPQQRESSMFSLLRVHAMSKPSAAPEPRERMRTNGVLVSPPAAGSRMLS
jgi:hypothetical protein